jgi:hypothetical protein
MPDWKQQALELRDENLSLAAISLRVGKSKSAVAKVCKGTSHDRAPWQGQAQEMRRNGAKFREIVAVVNRSHAQVVSACKGIVCPVDHVRSLAKTQKQMAREAAIKARAELKARRERLRQERANRSKEWREQARELCAQGKTMDEIAMLVGRHRESVRKACRGVHRPINFLAEQARRNFAKATAARKERARLESRLPKPPKPRTRPVISKEERRRREVRRVLQIATLNDHREKPPITLAKLAFMAA